MGNNKKYIFNVKILYYSKIFFWAQVRTPTWQSPGPVNMTQVIASAFTVFYCPCFWDLYYCPICLRITRWSARAHSGGGGERVVGRHSKAVNYIYYTADSTQYNDELLQCVSWLCSEGYIYSVYSVTNSWSKPLSRHTTRWPIVIIL